MEINVHGVIFTDDFIPDDAGIDPLPEGTDIDAWYDEHVAKHREETK